VGGGSPPRPGEISLAHGGVLFLDEAARSSRAAALEALREPLETGAHHDLARGAPGGSSRRASSSLAAMNPCPCGYLGAFAATGRACRCTPEQVARYQGKLSGPLLDRIDLRIEVLAVKPAELMAQPDGEASAVVAARVAAARALQVARQGLPNAQLEAADIDLHCRPDPAAAAFLRSAAERLGWSGRRLHRTLKVARTVADLAGSDVIAVAHVAEALQAQRALD
jgi:magnesium chelatase family protein